MNYLKYWSKCLCLAVFFLFCFAFRKVLCSCTWSLSQCLQGETSSCCLTDCKVHTVQCRLACQGVRHPHPWRHRRGYVLLLSYLCLPQCPISIGCLFYSMCTWICIDSVIFILWQWPWTAVIFFEFMNLSFGKTSHVKSPDVDDLTYILLVCLK